MQKHHSGNIPSKRAQHSMVIDDRRGLISLVGGHDDVRVYSDVYCMDINPLPEQKGKHPSLWHWTRLDCTNETQRRRRHTRTSDQSNAMLFPRASRQPSISISRNTSSQSIEGSMEELSDFDDRDTGRGFIMNRLKPPSYP